MKTKQRVYDERRQFLGNYKTVVGKEEALQRVIGEDSQEGLLPGPFSEPELRHRYPKVLLNCLCVEIKDVKRPDARTLADATQGDANQHFGMAMRPNLHSLSDEMRIPDFLGTPIGVKFDGNNARRTALKPGGGPARFRLLGRAVISTLTPSALSE